VPLTRRDRGGSAAFEAAVRWRLRGGERGVIMLERAPESDLWRQLPAIPARFRFVHRRAP